MATERTYSCVMTNGGGFGSGYGGTYDSEFIYTSTHRAGSKANEEDACFQWRCKHGRAGWCEVKHGSVYRVDTRCY